jgi:hypothetical protein
LSHQEKCIHILDKIATEQDQADENAVSKRWDDKGTISGRLHLVRRYISQDIVLHNNIFLKCPQECCRGQGVKYQLPLLLLCQLLSQQPMTIPLGYSAASLLLALKNQALVLWSIEQCK